MTYDQWIETYKPVENHLIDRGAIDNILFETFDQEANYVWHLRDNNVVWTWLDDGNGGNSYIVSGFWRINRLGYFITEVPFEGEYGDITINL